VYIIKYFRPKTLGRITFKTMQFHKLGVTYCFSFLIPLRCLLLFLHSYARVAGELGYLSWCSDSLQAGQLRNRGSVSGRGNRFSLVHSIQTSSGSHPASFLVGGWGESNCPVCPEKCSESRIVYLSWISTTSFLSFLINHSRSICHSILYTLCS
jgi:hypothetical protein